MKKTLLLLSLFLFVGITIGQTISIKINGNLASPPGFALKELNKCISDQGLTPVIVDSLKIKNDNYLILINSIEETKKDFPKPESFRITRDGKTIIISGSDAVGLMYGIYEVAEMVKYAEGIGDSILNQVKNKYNEPALEIRADNPFFTIEGDTTGIAKWFYDENYWERYFTKLAQDRYNLCDIHAMYRYQKTNFPNIFPFFLVNPHMPEVKWQDEDQERNLAMLKKIVSIAESHGVHVALMNYSTDTPNINMGDEEKLADYMSWAVAKLLNEIPDLWMFGFRIGESGKSESFFEKSYLKGIAESGKKHVRLYTRTWLAEFKNLAKIGMKYPDNFYIEIKYNGEHLGAPYHAMQGRWGSYSYEKYLNYPRYWKIIWQIRPNGTHRLFPWNDADFARRTMRSCTFGDAVGFNMEPITAYYPQEPERTYIGAEDYKFMKYTTDRYWSWYLLWGRLSYDPTTPDEVFINAFKDRFGKNSGEMIYDVTTLGSRIVPLIYRHHTIGPDHRDHAPEFESGNRIEKSKPIHNIDDFAKATVIDKQNYLNCADFVDYYLKDSVDGKITPLQSADELDNLADQVIALFGKIDPTKSWDEWNLWENDLIALTELARYYAEKDRATVALQFYYKTNDLSKLEESKSHTKSAIQHWQNLSEITSTQYKPILDPLRTGKEFIWENEMKDVKADLQRINSIFNEVENTEKSIYGHVPIYQVNPDKDLEITVGFKSNITDKIKLHYAVDNNEAETINCEKKNKWSYSATIPAEKLDGNKLNYWFSFVEKKAKRIILNNDKAFSAYITNDNNGPEIHWNEDGIKESKYSNNLHLEVLILDNSDVKNAWVEWKPMPSDINWQKPIPLKKRVESNIYYADLPLDYQGLLYSVVAIDSVGNATRYPDARYETPYRYVNPYDDGLPPDMKVKSMGIADKDLKVKTINWKDVSKMGRPGGFWEFIGKDRSIKYEFEVDKYSDYILTVAKVAANNFGKADVFIDGEKLGVLDCRMDINSIVPVLQDFKPIRLNKGKHTLTITMLDKSIIGFEGFKVTDIPAKIDKFLISQSFSGFISEAGKNMYPIGNNKIVWRKADILENGVVRLDAQLDPNENCHAFAATEIICDKEIKTTLHIGHNDGVFIWLNGKIVYEYPRTHAFRYNEFSTPITLKKGKNLLVMIIMQAGRNWLFNLNLDTYDFRTEIPSL